MIDKSGCPLLIILLLLSAGSLSGLSLFREEVIPLEAGQSQFQLYTKPLIAGSERLSSAEQELQRGIDYQIDYHSGLITLIKPLETSYLSISYVIIPPKYLGKRHLYQVRPASDSLFQNIQPTRRASWWQEDGKLLISGSKTFALSFGDDNAFDLKQSLYVNLSGELAEGVSISGQLSDSQSKLTPEGDSRELSSLDQVFIKVYGAKWNLAMGDLELKYEGSRYLDYYSKFEGVSGQIGASSWLQAAYSVGGGKNTHLDLRIIDGKQGPYYLNPTGQPGSLLIIAGSESVYQNGKLLERGSDYYIDYSEGSLMFQKLVFSTDKISVWFKYSSESFSRHSILSSSSWQITPGLRLSHRLITASDAKDKPLLFEYTSSDLDSLRQAGDHPAWGNGATQVEPGQGLYRLITSVDGISYFQYADIDSLADYNVIFSYVGYNLGDYEQYSSGKYRYLGHCMGDWLPLKRLTAPTSIINSSLRAEYEAAGWNLGTEAVFTSNDANTLSPKDDQDNLGGYLYSWLKFTNTRAQARYYLALSHEKRWINTSLVSDYSASVADYDLGPFVLADSLAYDSYSLKTGIDLPKTIRPELDLRYLHSTSGIRQKSLRFSSSSSAWKIIPRLDIRSTFAQTYARASNLNSGFSTWQYVDGSWSRNMFKLGSLFNLQKFVPNQESQASTQYLKLNPYLELGNAKTHLSRLALISDQNKISTAQSSRSQKSQTWSFRQQLNSENHNLNLDYNRRNLQAAADSAKSSYELIALKANSGFLKRSITIIGNYQLNHTEFFPKIRELEYVGAGLGVYDSTGVAVSNGDWDYVYITSSKGRLSAERNAQLNLYLKPGNISQNDILRRISTDILLLGSQQQTQPRQDFLSYIFGSAFADSLTIFAKQSYQQNIWLELMRNKILMLMLLDYQHTLDNRYQEQSDNKSQNLACQLDFNRIGDYSFGIKGDMRSETESRYHTKAGIYSLHSIIQRSLGKTSVLRIDLDYTEERGKSTVNSDSFRLRGIGISPNIRSNWGSKGKISGGINLRYNIRSGDELLSFIAEKRGGFFAGANISALYRLNAFSTASLDYSISSKPGEKLYQQLKLEFKAEL